jgi:hypothetical protein
MTTALYPTPARLPGLPPFLSCVTLDLNLSCPHPSRPPFQPPSPNAHTTEAALGDKFLKNVAMGEDDSDILSALGELLVERFGAVTK